MNGEKHVVDRRCALQQAVSLMKAASVAALLPLIGCIPRPPKPPLPPRPGRYKAFWKGAAGQSHLIVSSAVRCGDEIVFENGISGRIQELDQRTMIVDIAGKPHNYTIILV